MNDGSPLLESELILLWIDISVLKNHRTIVEELIKVHESKTSHWILYWGQDCMWECVDV